MSEVTAVDSATNAPLAGIDYHVPDWGLGIVQRAALFCVSMAIGIGVWWFIARSVNQPIFFPSPLQTWGGAKDLIRQGLLQEDIRVSLTRIVIGWAIGCAVGVPIGL